MVERAVVEWLNESDKKESMVIYGLVFPNNKIYVGQTRCRLVERVNKCHRIISDNPRCRRECATKKYKTFIVTLLDICKTIDELNEREIYWIKFFHSTESDRGYNLQLGGNSGESRKGEDHPLYGVKKPVGTGDKISKAKSGVKFTEEHKQSLRESRAKQTNFGFKKVICLFDGLTYNSIKEASNYYNIPMKYIIDSCKTGTKVRWGKLKGVSFAYFNDILHENF